MIRETELISLKDGKTKSLTEFVQDLAPMPEPMDLTPTTPVDTGGADPVALSSYIDGIADTSASDAITAGLASGGAIEQAIAAAGGGSTWEVAWSTSRTVNKTLTATYQNILNSTLSNVVVTDKDYCIGISINYTKNGGSEKTLYFQKMGHMFSNRANRITFGSIKFDYDDLGITIDLVAGVVKESNIVKITSLDMKVKIDDASKNCVIVDVYPSVYIR